MASWLETIGFTSKQAVAMITMVILLIGFMSVPNEDKVDIAEAFFSSATNVSREAMREAIEEYINQGIPSGSPWQTEKFAEYYFGSLTAGGTPYFYLSDGRSGVMDDYDTTESTVLGWLRNNVTGDTFYVNGSFATGRGFEIEGIPDTTSRGFYTFGQAGEALSQGEAVYLETDGDYNLADCDAAGTMYCSAIVAQDIANEAWGLFLIEGIIRVDGQYGDIPIGPTIPMYISGTAGVITSNVPVGAGDQVQRVGYGVAFGTLYFDPDSTIVEIS